MENKLSASTNSVYDLLKFILSFAVIAIHSSFLPHYLYPWLRIAVPLYFMISSYFFFSKVGRCENLSEKKTALIKFIKRNAQLYLFWFIVLFPVSWKLKNWFSKDSLAENIRIFLKNLLFSSTFKASWFITALVTAVIIVFLLSKRLSGKTVFVLTFLVFCVICIRSSYFPMISNIRIIRGIFFGYEYFFSSLYNSFPVALFWVSCGKLFAEKEIKISRRTSIVILAVSLIALYAESRFVEIKTGHYGNDCYFSLAPICISAFSIVQSIKPFTLKHSAELRKISTIVYALHASVAFSIFEHIEKNDVNIECFLLTAAISFAVSVLILVLERIKIFSWLKYSH